ncbi:hypothetical protein [Paenibacillus mucilaginosus]|uniref:Uncharacterized protein n=1 Tax=Paenibacillus mucilaginosus (strain KNP414) TaxID=1036673 RepID=F8F865_PAEMK|nr:hypothetical protein [Paenibacillus mucilaginosus]AEI41050.1 hypothetical protein KNP414_02489 [Paenibacillus mucilaginosus KNP414]MCG7211507.1 hypothetical protein [Paenibacillus mucilaginosus]WDM30118.1 hypothetical protein KCX80_13655 [Paenibacillus mucilaginosus]
MSGYFSVYYTFPYASVTPKFVREVYEIVFKYYPFQAGYWEAENDSLEEIIEWNADLLARRFQLGYDQHVRHDYKQVLLQSGRHSHLRLFWNIEDSGEVSLNMIAPENEVLFEGVPWRFKGEQIQDFIGLSVELWQTRLLSSVQTYLECDGPRDTTEILQGAMPAYDPFCIVDEDTYLKLEEAAKRSGCSAKPIPRGVLLIQAEYADWVERYG